MYNCPDSVGEQRRRAAMDRKIESVNELERLLIGILDLWDKPLEEESFLVLMGMIKSLESCAFRTWANLFNTSDNGRDQLIREINEIRQAVVQSEIDKHTH